MNIRTVWWEFIVNLYFHEFCDLAKLAHFLDPYVTGFVKGVLYMNPIFQL